METLNELALFAGAGGGILGGKLLGWKTVCAVEIEPYPASILIKRQNEGFLKSFPIWDDVRSFDGRPWKEIVDVVSAGFPCQDISVAGKGAGISGKQSGLWKEAARIVGEVRPGFAFLENSPALTSRGLDVVLGDLAEMGYDAEWCVLGGSDVGAWHQRKRIWILAADNRQERVQRFVSKKIPWKHRVPWCQDVRGIEDLRKRTDVYSPQLCRGSNGVADYVDRISAIGNGQIPTVAASAFSILINRFVRER
jgi:DNA (cytosine-5)-methyltransferase 1